jgi:hypothetical protein
MAKTTATTISLDDQIVEEELLIRLYQNELDQLKRYQSRRHHAYNNDDALACTIMSVTPEQEEQVIDDDDETDNVLLDWMHHKNSLSSQELSKQSADSLDSAPLARMNRLQALLSGFCIESVHRLLAPNRSNTLQEKERKIQEVYRLQGYFVDDPSLGAAIRMELHAESFQEGNDTSTTKERQLRIAALDFSIQSRIASLEATEQASRHSYDSDILWLQHQVVSANRLDPLNLSSWVEGLTRYLRFRNQRLAFLQEHEKVIAITKQVHSNMTIELLLGGQSQDANDETNSRSIKQHTTIHLEWDWSWKHQKDFLRMPETIMMSLSMHRAGLKHLVELTGSSQAAIGLMLATANSSRCQGSSSDNSSDKEKDKDDDDDDSADDDLGFKADDDDDYSSSGEDDEDQHYYHEEEHKLSEYELERLERIKRNEAYFASLGLNDAKETLKKQVKGKRYKTK